MGGNGREGRDRVVVRGQGGLERTFLLRSKTNLQLVKYHPSPKFNSFVPLLSVPAPKCCSDIIICRLNKQEPSQSGGLLSLVLTEYPFLLENIGGNKMDS